MDIHEEEETAIVAQFFLDVKNFLWDELTGYLSKFLRIFVPLLFVDGKCVWLAVFFVDKKCCKGQADVQDCHKNEGLATGCR